MSAITRFLQLQLRLNRVTRAQLEALVGQSLTQEEFLQICGEEGRDEQ